MSFITVDGENKIAAMIANETPLDITHFVFANITGLGTEPADRIEALPDVGDIVDTRVVANQGYVSPNKVVYSIILDSSVGDYQFNWVGLKDVDGVLIACEYIPLTTKTKTNGGVQGNNLARNFLIEFNGAQSITGIDTPAETWQFNFNNRLLQIDERERLSNWDLYGDAIYFGTGFLVSVTSGSTVSMAAGIAFVGGIRCESNNAIALVTAGFATDIYMDASLQGDISGVDAVYSFVDSVSPLSNYTDAQGFKHYVYKIAHISAGGVVTDLRPLFYAYATKKGVRNVEYSTAVMTGTANAMIGTVSPAPTALVDGMTIHFNALGKNTVNNPIFNLNGLGDIGIVKGVGSALAVGDIYAANHKVSITYSAALNAWVLLNPSTSANLAQSTLLQVVTTNLYIKPDASYPLSRYSVTAQEVMLIAGTDAIKMQDVNLTLNMFSSGLNGLDVGTVQNNTWYTLYLIGTGTTTGVIASLSTIAPNMPFGYNYQAYIGSLKIGADGNIVHFTQRQNVVAFKRTNVLTAGQASVSGTFQGLNIASAVPPQAKKAKMLLTSSSGTTNGVLRVAANAAGDGMAGGNVSFAAGYTESVDVLITDQQLTYWTQVVNSTINCQIDVVGFEV